MAVSGGKKRTGARKFTAADRLMAIAPLLPQNRPPQSVPFCRFQSRDCLGRYVATSAAPGAGPASFSGMVQAIATEHSVSERTIWRWLSQNQRGGYAALHDRPRRDHGHPRRSGFAVVRFLIKERGCIPHSAWREMFRHYGADAPCSRTVSRWAKLIAAESSAAVPRSEGSRCHALAEQKTSDGPHGEKC